MLRVRVNWTGTSVGPTLSTFWFNNTGDSSSAAATAVAVKNFLTALNGSVVTGASATIDPEVAEIDAATGDLFATFPVTQDPVTFAGGTGPLPRANQGLIRLGTGVYLNGRRIVGHLFIPGVVTAVNSNGAPTAAYVNSLQAAANGLMNDANTAWCVYSRVNGLAAPITSPSAKNYFAVLRSRRD